MARSDDLDLKSPFLRIGGAGAFDIGRGRIDYVARATVTETSKGQDGAELAALKGVTVPVHLTGPFEAIDWKIQWSGVAAAAVENRLKDKLAERLGVKPADGAASAPVQSPRDAQRRSSRTNCCEGCCGEHNDVSVTLAGVNVYPIKSCGGVAVSEAMLIETGLEFDRAWMVVDAENRFVTQRELPRMALVQPALRVQDMVLRAPGMLALHIALDAVEAPTRVRVWKDEVAAYDMGDSCGAVVQRLPRSQAAAGALRS